MVYFTCNHCGSSLKKSQVEKHCKDCRRPISVSCIDCHKDFNGNSFQAHTTCITEQEKYAPKGFVPKSGWNKGERKQQAWVDIVRSVQQDNLNLSKDDHALLDAIKKYENIPKKKMKFQNFVGNAFRGRFSPRTIEHVWNLLEKTKEKLQSREVAAKSEDSSETAKSSETMETASDVQENKTESEEPCQEHSLMKELHLEERQEHDVKSKHNEKNSKKKRKTLKENEEEESKAASPFLEGAVQNGVKSKKIHKKGNDNPDSEMVSLTECTNKGVWKSETEEIVAEEASVKVKKSKKRQEEDQEEEASPAKKVKHNDTEPQGVNDGCLVQEYVKFNWQRAILDILASKGEISYKRLQKKVLAEYGKSRCGASNMVKAVAKFNRKLLKTPGVNVHENIVKLDS